MKTIEPGEMDKIIVRYENNGSAHYDGKEFLDQSINQSIYSFSPMQEVAGIYTDIYYTYWTWYYS